MVETVTYVLDKNGQVETETDGLIDANILIARLTSAGWVVDRKGGKIVATREEKK